MQAVVELHLARHRIVVLDQRRGVVEQQLARQPAEVPERALDPLQPRRLPLMRERLDVNPTRVAQHGDEQIHPAPLAALHHDPPLAEVDLQLPFRRRLEPHRRQRRRRKLLPQVRHRPLHRAQARHHAQLGRQLLAHHVGVAAVATQPLSNPLLMPRQNAGPRRNPGRRPTARGYIPLHRLPVAAHLGRAPARAPAQPVQLQHRRHLVRRPHHLSPPIHDGQRNAHLVNQFASSLLCRVAGFLMSPLDGFTPCRLTYLALLRFFLNHRRFLRNRHAERLGKSPRELMTGQGHPHWLTLLGLGPLQPQRA